jgi:calpain-15
MLEIHQRVILILLLLLFWKIEFVAGDWSDDSHLWSENPDLRRELLNEKRNKRDGVFWMPFTSFVKYFECVDICKLRHNWYEVRDSANFYPASKMMQGISLCNIKTTKKKIFPLAYYLRITNVTEIDITLHRKISKNLRIQRSDVSLCIAIISMEEQSSGNYRIYSIPIISQRGQHKFISTDGYLQPGTYVILPFLFNPTNKYLDNTEFTIGLLFNIKLNFRV